MRSLEKPVTPEPHESLTGLVERASFHNGGLSEVKDCADEGCSQWKFRMGHRVPKERSSETSRGQKPRHGSTKYRKPKETYQRRLFEETDP